MGTERIAVMDVLRGAAILGILYMNIGDMAVPLSDRFGQGWSGADYTAFGIVYLFLSGTQRGVLQLLFGAGSMILLNRATARNGGRAAARLFYRRNLWLLAFGLFDVFGLLWFGDVLHVYALAALLLFPFRHLRARWLIPLGLVYACWGSIHGWGDYQARRVFTERVVAAQEQRAAGTTPTRDERVAEANWRETMSSGSPSPLQRAARAREERARHDGLRSYAEMHWNRWWRITTPDWLGFIVWEAFSTMLIGMALWRLGIIQGRRSLRFYGVMAVLCYAIGVGLRAIDMPTIIAGLPAPMIQPLVDEWARLAVSLGQVAVINAVMKLALGRRVMQPLVAGGRAAFSIYLLQSFVTLWLLFAPWGPGLWGDHGWVWLVAVATAIDATLLIAANLWMRRFAIGPLEWLWRSLSYGRRQRFRNRREEALATLPV